VSNKRCADVVLSAANLKSTTLLKGDERQEPAVESSVVFGGHRDNLVQQPGRLRRQPCNLYERKANGSQPFSTLSVPIDSNEDTPARTQRSERSRCHLRQTRLARTRMVPISDANPTRVSLTWILLRADGSHRAQVAPVKWGKSQANRMLDTPRRYE
jgi:hypothetical protein